MSLLLGNISEHFIQNTEVKVILIANEAEIEKEIYFNFKDKIVGRTIKFQSSEKLIYKQINSQFKIKSEFYQFLNNSSDFIFKLFEYFKIKNLRC